MLGLTMKTTMGELALIERIRSGWGGGGPLGSRGRRGHPGNLMLGIGDDCAILRLPQGHELLVTTDFTLEGRHFRRDWHPPESVGHRTLARGLSDLAAMGARPLAAFLSLALPGEMLGTAAGGGGWSVSLPGCAAWPSHTPFHWPVGTQPNRLADWCSQTLCWWDRPQPAARCGAAEAAPAMPST